MRLAGVIAGAILLPSGLSAAEEPLAWATIGRDPQHTGISNTAGQPIHAIKWSTPVDLTLAGTPGPLLIHFGSPLITAGNTILVPVRTSAGNRFEIRALNAASGALKYTLSTSYTPPAHRWVPSYSPGLANNRLYYPCSGGVVCYRDNPDEDTGPSGQIAFYGTDLYRAHSDVFDSTVRISTPIVSDSQGNIFFGFRVSGPNPANLASGLARIPSVGAASWVRAADASADPSMTQVALNSAPALSHDQQTLYFPVIDAPDGRGFLVAANASTLAPLSKVRLKDPRSGLDAVVLDDSTASPTVGPDGDVYFGVYESPCCANNSRGWMLHFDRTLAVVKVPGAFGWDADASIVLRELVPGYSGSSSYLILTKYNNYKGAGSGDGANRLALLDPNTAMADRITGALVMQEVYTILGPTPDGDDVAVKEWCITSAVIDVPNKSALVNSEDGRLYRWDLTTNTFSQEIALSAGVAAAYTPTLIGPDGTVYAINDAILFAVGAEAQTSIRSRRTRRGR